MTSQSIPRMRLTNSNSLLIVLWVSMPIFCGSSESELEVWKQFLFPYHTDTVLPFVMQPKNRKFDIDRMTNDTLSISIINQTGTVMDTYDVLIDGKYIEKVNYSSSYMSIIEWTKSLSGNNIRLTMSFKEVSHGHNITIDQFDKFNSPTNILNTTILLQILSEVEIDFYSVDRRVNEVLINTTGIVTCRGYGRPQFLNLNESLKDIQNLKRQTSKIKVEFIAKVEDHLKTVWCQVGNSKRSIVIKVLHPPSKVLVDPLSCQKVVPGTNISCKSIDGFPKPLMKWSVLSGPTNDGDYYEIKGNVFHLKRNAPFCSSWHLVCSSTNLIDKKQNVHNRSVKFVVEDEIKHQLLLSKIATLHGEKESLTNRMQTLQQTQNEYDTKTEELQKTIETLQKEVTKTLNSVKSMWG